MLTRVWVWVWAGVAAVGVALVVKDAPTEATRLYKAPPTNSRKNGRALSSTIIVSQPLGFSVDPVKAPQDRPDPPKKSDNPRDSFTRPHYTAALSQETKKKIQDEVKSVSEEDDSGGSAVVGVKDKIKFYTLECRVGEACSAIIPAPAPVTVRPSARAFSSEQLKQYLAQFNLRSGFDYSESFEDSGNPDLNPTPAPSRSPAASERSLGSHYDYSNFWPGSKYRPRPSPPGRGSVYKYQPYRPTVAPVHDLTWDKFTSGKLPYRVWADYFRPGTQSSTQSSTYPAFRPRPQSSTSSGYGNIRPDPQDGQWKRYGTSTVAQLDKNSGVWTPVSSTTTQLDPLPIDTDYNQPNAPRPSSHSAPHRTQVKLTVLGVNDHRSYSLNSDPGTGHVMKLPSAFPGQPPALIETGGPGLPLSSPRQTSFASLTPTGVLHVSLPLTFLSTSQPSPTSPRLLSSPSPIPSSSPLPPPRTDQDPSSTTSTTSPPSTTTTTTSTTTTTTTSTTTTTATTTPRPPPSATPRTTTPTTTAAPSIFDSPAAVMAIVGAGLVPATFIALLPVLAGRRRRKRSFSTFDTSAAALNTKYLDSYHLATFKSLPDSSNSIAAQSHLYSPSATFDIQSAVIPAPLAADESTFEAHLNSLVKSDSRFPLPATTPAIRDDYHALPTTLATLPATLPLTPANHSLLASLQATVATFHNLFASPSAAPDLILASPTTHNLAERGNPWRRQQREKETPTRDTDTMKKQTSKDRQRDTKI